VTSVFVSVLFQFPLQNEWLATGADFHTVACDLRGYSPKASPDGIENYSYEIFAQVGIMSCFCRYFYFFFVMSQEHRARTSNHKQSTQTCTINHQDAWAIADKVGFEEFHLIGHDHGAGLGTPSFFCGCTEQKREK
jgi:hypothetical protein